MKAQGATEYLVLLAVVLIVALVSVALLGFFPGMASDAQVTQSQMYWKSASPIAITEWGAINHNNPGRGTNFTLTYLRIRNNGPYTITITKVVGGNDSTSLVWIGGWDPSDQIRNYFTLAPGEETYFGSRDYWNGLPSQRKFFGFPKATYASSATSPVINGAAQSQCEVSPPYGQLMVRGFGFEYIQYMEGQQITKRQIGKELIIKCREGTGTG